MEEDHFSYIERDMKIEIEKNRIEYQIVKCFDIIDKVALFWYTEKLLRGRIWFRRGCGIGNSESFSQPTLKVATKIRDNNKLAFAA